MAEVDFISPLDQPLGDRRLLEELRQALVSTEFSRLTMIVAYAKSGPFLRLAAEFLAWKSAGKEARAIIGIDQQGTSREAIYHASRIFEPLYYIQERDITFHPKIYLFEGTSNVKVIIGSNNFTVGGTETNFECSTIINMSLPDDAPIYEKLLAMWEGLTPDHCLATRILNSEVLAQLLLSGAVIGEREMFRHPSRIPNRPKASKSGMAVKPASAIPKNVMTANKGVAYFAQAYQPQFVGAPEAVTTAPVVANTVTNGLAIQIRVHPNGEIHLSKLAVNQDPEFFGWPFTGLTAPKKAENAAYPQRTPDPVVDIDVYGAATDTVFSIRNYALNTVYYTTNAEIRVTAAPLVEWVPPFSVMVMLPGSREGVDYELSIYRPDSPDFAKWLAICNQTMPAGGAPIARKFGWF